MFGGISDLKKEGRQDLERTQDIELREPQEKRLTNNDVTMKFLSSSATLSEVISKVNELIKRNVTYGKVK